MRKRHAGFWAACSGGLLFGVIGLWGGHAAAQVPVVPAEHPRLYLRSADLPAIRAKLRRAELPNTDPAYSTALEYAWSIVRNNNGNSKIINAFLYLVNGEQARGATAIAAALGELQAAISGDNQPGRDAMWQGAIVYDWCYHHPDMTAQTKTDFVTEFVRLASGVGPGYPADFGANAVQGHTQGWINRSHLPVGLAMYDEDPVLYDSTARLYFEKVLPVRNFFYPAHMHHQGNTYGIWHFEGDLYATLLLRALGAQDAVSDEQQYVAYDLIYTRRPDNRVLPRGGDGGPSGDKDGGMFVLAGGIHQDPHLLWMVDVDFYSPEWINKGSRDFNVFTLILRDPDVATRPPEDLPLTMYFPPPMGEMVARTGWDLQNPDSHAAIVHMRIGEYFFGNHQFKDFGTFEVYYRGPLAIASGSYSGLNPDGTSGQYGTEQWKNYYHQTISKNGLLIFDPSEWQSIYGTEVANDGGQYWPNGAQDHPPDLETLLDPSNGYRMGEVTAHEFGPDPMAPLYGYLAGDITRAYGNGKAALVTRSMVALNTGDATYPAALVVFDRVTSTDASFKKTWLLHSIQEPTVSGSTTTIVRDTDGYGGKLVVETLLPDSPAIVTVGGPGREWWIESTQRNYQGFGDEAGAWRVEVSPAARSLADHFLHVLTVMDATTAAGPAVERLTAGDLVGARVLDRAVLFSLTGEVLASGTLTLDAPGPTQVLVCDLLPGPWTVRRDGAVVATPTATADGKCIYFTGSAGTYTLGAGGVVAPAPAGCGCSAAGVGARAGLTWLLGLAVLGLAVSRRFLLRPRAATPVLALTRALAARHPEMGLRGGMKWERRGGVRPGRRSAATELRPARDPYWPGTPKDLIESSSTSTQSASGSAPGGSNVTVLAAAVEYVANCASSLPPPLS